MKESSKNPSGYCPKVPWTNNSNPIWLASTIRLYRNVEKFKFPNKLSADRRKQIISLTTQELLESDLLTKPKLLKAEELTPFEKDFLFEHFLTPHSFHQAHGGEGFVVDDSGQFLAAFNIRDHIELQITDCAGELENSWNRLVKIEMALGKTVNYSYSTKFGFLTANPMECGTALLVSLFLQLPALIHTNRLDDILAKRRDDAIIITGLHGSPKEVIGDLLMIQNNYTLGVTEENIISSLRNFTTKLIIEEKSARTHIRQENHPEIKDKISRVFGILFHSYKIEALEAMNALSLLKLGVDLGWVEGITITALNELFFRCRRAHLLTQYQEEISQEELPHKRAEFIHRTLKDVKLII